MRRSTKEIIRLALEDAISWQRSLVDGYDKDDPERPELVALLEDYERVLKRRYPPRKDPMEGVPRVCAYTHKFSQR